MLDSQEKVTKLPVVADNRTTLPGSTKVTQVFPIFQAAVLFSVCFALVYTYCDFIYKTT